MWQSKLLSLFQVPAELLVNKRFCHFKFNKSKLKKQANVLERFDSEIEDAMNKIKRKQKLTVRRGRHLLTETTNCLLKQNTGDYTKPMDSGVFATGIPEQLMFQRDGINQKFLTTKMKIINTNYSRAIAEIFIADDELFKKVEEYKIRITQSRITTNLRILQIYWVTDDEKIDQKQVYEYLNTTKGRIREALSDAQHASVVPWVAFVYDLEEATQREISHCLDKCKADLIEATEQPDSDQDKQIDFISQKDFKLADQISFDGPIEEIPIEELYQKMVGCNLQELNDQHRLRLPEDMTLSTANLDYEHLMNKVLRTMYRSRAQQRLSGLSLNAVGAHLPPIEFNSQSGAPTVDYNTDERIKAIKKFVNLNKKNREKETLKLKRMILREEIDRHELYEDLRQKMEERMDEYNDGGDDDVPSSRVNITDTL